MSVSSSKSASQGKLLIAGMSRSGTTWLTRVLNTHPQVAAFGESMFWGREYRIPEADGCYSLQQLREVVDEFKDYDWAPRVGQEGALQSLATGELRDSIAAEFEGLPEDVKLRPEAVFQKICEAVARAEGKDLGIEKTPHHVMWLDRIQKACPDFRMIVTVRDPYGFMLSYKHQGDRKDPQTRKRFEKRYHPLACALVWKRYAEASAQAKREFPNQILLLDFNEFRNNETESLNSVQEFLELEPHDLTGAVPQANSSFPGGKRPELKPEDIFWMNLLASPQIDSLGYERKRAPFAPLRIGYSLLRLSWWGAWNFFDLRKIVSGSYWQYLRRWLSGK